MHCYQVQPTGQFPLNGTVDSVSVLHMRSIQCEDSIVGEISNNSKVPPQFWFLWHNSKIMVFSYSDKKESRFFVMTFEVIIYIPCKVHHNLKTFLYIMKRLIEKSLSKSSPYLVKVYLFLVHQVFYKRSRNVSG